jgi:integrase
MAKFQRGSLRKEARAGGNTVWVYRFTTIRENDFKRVERNRVIGSTREFSSESSVWAEINRLDLLTAINSKPDYKSPKVTFGRLTERFTEDELGDCHLVTKRAVSTKHTYKMYLRLYLKPQWSNRIATRIDHVEIQRWLQRIKAENGLSDPTCHRLKQLMGLVYGHGHWTKMIPETCNPTLLVKTTTVSKYKAKVLDPRDSYRIFCELKAPENVLILLLATTGLRISEALGLKWSDIDWNQGLIHIQRSWTMGHEGDTKTEASEDSVPCSPILAEYLHSWRHNPVCCYAKDTDWVFASERRKGAKPRSGGILSHDYVKQVGIRLGLVNPKDRFGCHNLRHSLATFLVALKYDPKTVQGLLRHSDVHTTLQLYAHGRHSDRLLAHEAAVSAFFSPATDTVQ